MEMAMSGYTVDQVIELLDAYDYKTGDLTEQQLETLYAVTVTVEDMFPGDKYAPLRFVSNQAAALTIMWDKTPACTDGCSCDKVRGPADVVERLLGSVENRYDEARFMEAIGQGLPGEHDSIKFVTSSLVGAIVAEAYLTDKEVDAVAEKHGYEILGAVEDAADLPDSIFEDARKEFKEDLNVQV
jgi:hypothetical protein